jgi:nucleoside-diphosphate-sugar epimerase
MKSLEMPNLKGEIINLGNSHPVKLMDLINKIETLTDKKLNINYAPLSRGDVSFTYANIDKAKKLLNWLPKYSLDEGLKELVNWYTHK